MRGERMPPARQPDPAAGSSPHARGTPDQADARPAERRIIPACAGNASRSNTGRPLPKDHPRMRGERGSASSGKYVIVGSSPHARGTPVGPVPVLEDRRIIPACAGNAAPTVSPAYLLPDHPRMRGERGLVGFDRHLPFGSSPHARGTLHRHHTRLLGVRIIPACAGNAAVRRRRCAAKSDHPRMRGERTTGYRRSPNVDGSSPHARGTP